MFFVCSFTFKIVYHSRNGMWRGYPVCNSLWCNGAFWNWSVPSASQSESRLFFGRSEYNVLQSFPMRMSWRIWQFTVKLPHLCESSAHSFYGKQDYLNPPFNSPCNASGHLYSLQCYEKRDVSLVGCTLMSNYDSSSGHLFLCGILEGCFSTGTVYIRAPRETQCGDWWHICCSMISSTIKPRTPHLPTPATELTH